MVTKTTVFAGVRLPQSRVKIKIVRAAVPDDPAGRHHRPNIGGSEQGAYDVRFRATSQKARLLAAYGRVGDLNASEAAVESGIGLGTTYWMRCSELRKAGLIEPVMDGENVVMRVGHAESPQMVCRITDAGRDVLDRLERAAQ